jgi:hypothetical protein
MFPPFPSRILSFSFLLSFAFLSFPFFLYHLIRRELTSRYTHTHTHTLTPKHMIRSQTQVRRNLRLRRRRHCAS